MHPGAPRTPAPFTHYAGGMLSKKKQSKVFNFGLHTPRSITSTVRNPLHCRVWGMRLELGGTFPSYPLHDPSSGPPQDVHDLGVTMQIPFTSDLASKPKQNRTLHVAQASQVVCTTETQLFA